MAEIIITSDFHIQEGIYTDICLDYIDYLKTHAEENNIKHIVIAGDVFEKSSKIKNEAFLPLFFKFMELKDEGYKLYFLLGNHDIYNVDNDSLVEAFAPFGEVIKDFKQVEIDGRTIDLLPYTKNNDDIPSSGDILITHLSIADFSFDNRYHVNEKMGMPTEIFEGYNIVFSGHFHRPQNKKNIVYMGSPYQMNFGEIGQKKGFITFNTDSGDWERVYYDQAPIYLKIKAKDFNTIKVNNAFVQVEIEEKLDNYVQLKHVLYENGALDVTPYFKETMDDISVNDDGEGINLNSGIKDMMTEYIMNNVSVENIDNKKLVDLFERVIEV